MVVVCVIGPDVVGVESGLCVDGCVAVVRTGGSEGVCVVCGVGVGEVDPGFVDGDVVGDVAGDGEGVGGCLWVGCCLYVGDGGGCGVLWWWCLDGEGVGG